MLSDKPQMSESFCLPFPCVCSETTPVSKISDFRNELEEEGITPSSSYYMTLPMEKFRPSPCSLLDTSATRAGDAHKLMVITVFHILKKMFYAEDPHVIIDQNTGARRFRVFMEYLLADETDPDDFTLIDCVGIRFHIHVYDPELKMMEAILKMIAVNSGEDVGGEKEDQAAGEENTESRPKKKQKKNNKKSYVPKKPPPISESYRSITDPVKWLILAGVFSSRGDDDKTNNGTDTYVQDTTDDVHAPREIHPYHTDNLFSWNNSNVKGMKEEQTVRSDTFPFPQAVYYVNGSIASPYGILGVTLPRTPMWFKQADYGMILETMQTLFNKEFMDAFFERMMARVKRNDLQEIKQVQDIRLNKIKCSALADDELYPKLRKFRERSVKYLANAWNPSAFVSDPIKVMSKTSGDMETWYSGPAVITDPAMSSFGNFVVDTMFGFEEFLRISTTHSILLRCLVNSLDAYRYEFNLHNNVLLVGAGATGKSHILEMLEKVLFLEDTVTKIAHLTDKAMTGDTDKNDLICTFHEMPPLLSGQDGKPGQSGDNTGGHLIKDMMTSCKVTTESIFVEDGKRTTFSASSERVSTMVMASNIPYDIIPEALATRMILIQVNMNERTKFSINEMTSNIRGIRCGEVDNAKSVYLRKWKVRQIMLNMVEKMIYVGALEDVDICVFDTVQLKMTEYMKHHDIMQNIGNDRSIKFLKRFARTMTILNAIDKFVSDPHSPGYDPEGNIKFGSVQSFQVLLQIQPYLFCTEEIALFTMTLNADQLIQVHHFQALEVILAMIGPYLVRNADETLSQKDGYWYTRSVFPDERYIYRKFGSAQNDTFTSKMSAENMKVSFRELRRRNYHDKAIVEFNAATQSLGVNAGFVNKHYEWNNGDNRYVCKFDLASIMTDVFYKSYANTFTRENKKCLTGITYDREMPFLFNTTHIKSNPKHVLTRNVARSIRFDGVEGHDEDCYYVRDNDKVRFKVNFEDYCYEQYMKQCGYTGQYSATDTVYDHHQDDGNTTSSYPEKQISEFIKFTGIMPKK